MNHFGKILRFELNQYFRKKSFVVITALFVAVIAIILFFPRVEALLTTGETESQQSQPVMLVKPCEGQDSASIHAMFSSAFMAYDVSVTTLDTDGIRSAVESGEVKCAFVLNGMDAFTYYVKDLTVMDRNMQTASAILTQINQVAAMIDNGLSPGQANDIMYMQIDGQVENLGITQIDNFFYAYVMTFAVSLAIMLYGQMVAGSVVQEKSSRAMELLITSTKPTAMMFGKVFAACLAGMAQLAVIFGTALVCYQCNRAYWEDNMMITALFNIPLEMLAYMLVFFILGFFVYAFMFSAAGSMASRAEDLNPLTFPINTISFVSMMIVMPAATTGDTSGTLLTVCSYIPFTSPLAMFSRVALSTVAWYEIAASIGILAMSSVVIGLLSARLYRTGVLLYGTPPKFSSILRMVLRPAKQ